MIITMKEEDLRAILETFKLTPQEIDRMLDDIRLPEGHTLTAVKILGEQRHELINSRQNN